MELIDLRKNYEGPKEGETCIGIDARGLPIWAPRIKETKNVIYIVDNGESYSSHSLYFVEVPAELLVKHKEVIESLLKHAKEASFIVGTAEKIDWWEGGAAKLHQAIYWTMFLRSLAHGFPVGGQPAKPHKEARWSRQCQFPNSSQPLTANMLPCDDFPEIPDEVAQYLLDGWRSHPGNNEFQIFAFDCFEEMLKKGELRPEMMAGEKMMPIEEPK